MNDKHINDIKFDPFDDFRFACRTSNLIRIYDIRLANRPQFVLRDEQMLGFEWSLHTANLIVSFNRNSSIVKFWDINSYMVDESRKVLLAHQNDYAHDTQSAEVQAALANY